MQTLTPVHPPTTMVQMHPTSTRLRASVWALVCLVTVVGVHLGVAASTPAPTRTTAVNRVHPAVATIGVPTHKHLAPTHQAKLPGHHLAPGITADFSYDGTARWMREHIPAGLAAPSSHTYSTNSERAPPTV